jgi:octaprenyl-diphosphate synthase
MWDFHRDAMLFLDNYGLKDDVKAALKAYLDFVIERKS